MKKLIVLFTSVVFMLAVAAPSFAAQDEKKEEGGKHKGKMVTVTGEGKCGKCALHETEKCQNVIETKEDGKTVKYYLTDNKVSKGFHENLCKESKKVTATGTVKEENGKMILTAKKIDLAKD